MARCHVAGGPILLSCQQPGLEQPSAATRCSATGNSVWANRHQVRTFKKKKSSNHRKKRNLHFETLTGYAFIPQVKKEGATLTFGANPSKVSLGTEGSERHPRALVPVCQR